MANGVWKGAYPQVLERSRQLSLNKFLDPSAPSMRKVYDGKKRKEKKKKIMLSYGWMNFGIDTLSPSPH